MYLSLCLFTLLVLLFARGVELSGSALAGARRLAGGDCRGEYPGVFGVETGVRRHCRIGVLTRIGEWPMWSSKSE